MAELRVRNFLCDFSLLPPTEFGAKNESNSRAEVPVIHLFGAAPSGRKACVHIHGALPYFIMRVGGELTEQVEFLMTEKLNKLLHHELNRKKPPEQAKTDTNIPAYIHHLEPFRAKSLYGFHSEMEQFAKVYFKNPFYVQKLSGVLGQLANENPIMQPFEAHVPFILQFFMDYSIFGMDWVHFKNVKFRLSKNRDGGDELYEKLTVEMIRQHPEWISPLDPSTSCYIEVDVSVDDIRNMELHSHNVHSSNPGLEYIWKEEAERCRLQNRPLEDAFNQYTPRPYPIIRTEKEHLEKLKNVVHKFEETLGTSGVVVDEAQQMPDTSHTKSKDAESFWSHALQTNEAAERLWTDTQDFAELGLEEGWISPNNFEEVEEDDEQEMDIPIEEAGLKKMTPPGEEIDRRSPYALEAEFLKRYRNVETPIAPGHQGTGIWYKPRKQLPLKRRVKVAAPLLAASNNPIPESKPVKALATLGNKMVFADDTVVSSGRPATNSPDTVSATDGSIEEVRDVSVASLELFIYTEHKMPNPTTDSILAASLCVADDACCTTKAAFHSVITVISAKMMPSKFTIVVADECQLLERIAGLVNDFDPDILIGYDVDRLSWGYLIKRAEVLGFAKFEHRLGRYINPRNEWQKDQRGSINIDGRLLESVWRIVRRDLTLRSYDRATACMGVLKRRIPVLDDTTLSRRYILMGAGAGIPIHYHIRRLSALNVVLLNSIDWFTRNAEMARVYGIQFHEVWTRGSQLRVESMLLRLAHRLKFVAPSVTIEQRDKMCAPEQLQLIMEPESKVYHDPVIVLDFQSLYPSMIGNLSAAAEVGSTYIDLGAIKYAVEKSSLIEAASNEMAHSSPLCTAFATASYRTGVISTMLKEVLGARIMVKTAMKNTNNKRLLRILDARQLALKLVANVTYGYTAANWSGRMPCVEIADAILAKGRETLERAIAMVNKGSYGGARVIYGDTDSMFVLVKGASLTEAFAIGRKIAHDVTADNPTPVVLKLEKVYTGCVLETKKRYAGWMYESENDKKPKLDAKGIETVRRDTCPIVAKILERSLEYILQGKFNKFLSFVDRKLTLLNETHFTEFVFCKEYRGDYHDTAHVPQKKVAEYNQVNSPGYYPLRGERLPYVVVKGDTGSTVISCVVSVEEFLGDEDLKINVPYYIRAHILAALHRVTDLLPLNIDYLDESSSDCFGRICSSMGGRPWCRSCAVPVETYILSTLQLSREQRIMTSMKRICCDCQNTRHVDIEACANTLCLANKLIVSISRSIAPLAVTEHRRHTIEGIGESVLSTSSTPNELEEEPPAEEFPIELSDEEDDEEYHERTIFHFFGEDEDTRW